MPRYDYECKKCKSVQEFIFRVREKPLSVRCPVCGFFMKSIISKVNIITDWAPYVDENMLPDPVLVTSRKHHSELLKRFNLEVKDPINRRRFKEKVDDLKNSRDARAALKAATGSNRRKTPDFSGRATLKKDEDGKFLVRQ
jgi:putative FmdB family regulatory protein